MRNGRDATLNFKPVVGKSSLVTNARCPNCAGAALYCIAAFMQTDDRAELERLKGLGYLEESGELRRMGNVDTCDCKSVNKAQPPQVHIRQRANSAPPSGRSTLSLKCD